MHVSINKASKLLGISRKQLKQDVKLGKLSLSNKGYIDCNQLAELYPMAYQDALVGKSQLWEGIKETSTNWKSGKREHLEKLENKQLVNRIRKLEAEKFLLEQRVIDLETLIIRARLNSSEDI